MKQHRMFLLPLTLFTFSLFGLLRASAADEQLRAPTATVGSGFTYQGFLEQNGAPVNTDCDMEFDAYLVEAGGSPIHGEAFDDQPVAYGLFNVVLNSDDGLTPHLGQDLWLELTVQCDSNPGVTLAPRSKIMGAPLAHSLKPGAIISGSVVDGVGGFSVERPILQLNPGQQSAKGVLIGRASGYGVLVQEYAFQGGPFNSVSNVASDIALGYGTIVTNPFFSIPVAHGLYVGSVEGNGVTINQADSIGVSVREANGSGVSATTLGSDSYGGVFKNDAASGVGRGLYAQGNFGTSADIILGANEDTATGDDGRIRSDPQYTGSDIIITSNDTVWIELDDDGNEANSHFYILNGSNSPVFSVDESGNRSTGSMATVVETNERSGDVELYAVASPENWFEDFGRGQLNAGEAVVNIEALFAETVNLDEDYHVFMTPHGPCSLYATDFTSSSFTVRSVDPTCDLTFDYRIIAKRSGYEAQRMDRFTVAEDGDSTFVATEDPSNE